MSLNTTQLMAASLAILTLEKLCRKYNLSHEDAMDAREVIVKVGKAFRFDSLAERPISNVIDLDTAAQALVRREMADG